MPIAVTITANRPMRSLIIRLLCAQGFARAPIAAPFYTSRAPAQRPVGGRVAIAGVRMLVVTYQPERGLLKRQALQWRATSLGSLCPDRQAP